MHSHGLESLLELFQQARRRSIVQFGEVVAGAAARLDIPKLTWQVEQAQQQQGDQPICRLAEDGKAGDYGHAQDEWLDEHRQLEEAKIGMLDEEAHRQ